jgi:hypothetical protein
MDKCPQSNISVSAHKNSGCRVWWGPKMVKRPGVKFEFGCLPKRTNATRVKFDFGTLKPNRPQWVPIIGKSLKFEFGSLPTRTNAPSVKFDFGPLNTQRTQWAPKIFKSPELNFSLGDSPKGQIPPE